MFVPPEAIHLGPLSIHLYSLFILVGLVAGYYLAKPAAAVRGITAEQLQTSIFYGFVGGLIGARAYHVIDQWQLYAHDPGDILAVWNGGLGILGGLAGGAIGLWLYARLHKVPLISLLDVWAPSALLGQAIGRFGNWTNQEAFGPPTDLPWKVYIDPAHRPEQYVSNPHFHPTFFYEAGWDFLAVLILVTYRKRLVDRPGTTLGLYLVLYSIGRIIAEHYRFGTAKLVGVPAAYVICGILLVLGLYLIGRTRPRATTPAAAAPTRRSGSARRRTASRTRRAP